MARVRLCTACDRPLPEYAGKCPYCGESLPGPRFLGIPVAVWLAGGLFFLAAVLAFVPGARLATLPRDFVGVLSKPAGVLAYAFLVAVAFVPFSFPMPGAPFRSPLVSAGLWLASRLALLAVLTVFFTLAWC